MEQWFMDECIEWTSVDHLCFINASDDRSVASVGDTDTLDSWESHTLPVKSLDTPSQDSFEPEDIQEHVLTIKENM